MLNKKGQTLILFVILIPVFVALIAVVVDVGSLHFTYQKLKGIVDESIKEYYLSDGLTSLEETLDYNDISSSSYEVVATDENVSVTLNYEMDAIFGKLVGLSSYDIKIERIGKMESGKIIINKGEESWEKKQEKVFVFFQARVV